MKITEIYETIILRDLLEYILPGSLFLLSLSFVLDCFAQKLGLDFSVIGTLTNSVFGVIVFILLAFPTGNLLSGLGTLWLKKIDSEQTKLVLQNKDWLVNQTSRAISYYLEIPESKAIEHLKNDQEIKMLREIGRDIIQARIPVLHREHVGRLSIVSRLFRSLSVSLVGVLISILISFIIMWENTIAIIQSAPITAFSAGAFIIAINIFLIVMFKNRSVRVRYRMIQLTFQIWCVSYYLDKVKFQ